MPPLTTQSGSIQHRVTPKALSVLEQAEKANNCNRRNLQTACKDQGRSGIAREIAGETRHWVNSAIPT